MIGNAYDMWIAPLVAMLVAQVLKPVLIMLRMRQWDWKHMRQSGGMPSSHTALVVALVTELWLREGGSDPVLAIAMFVALIVMYDAAGVRWQTGRHAAVLNRLLRDLQGRQDLFQMPVNAAHSLPPKSAQETARSVDGTDEDGAVARHEPSGQRRALSSHTAHQDLSGIRPLNIVKTPWWLVDWPVLNEHVGHKPTEVLGGCIVGVLVALLLYF
jgi:acid phosphatase family membrane protein YuiD